MYCVTTLFEKKFFIILPRVCYTTGFLFWRENIYS